MPRYFNAPTHETDWPDWPTRARRERPQRTNHFEVSRDENRPRCATVDGGARGALKRLRAYPSPSSECGTSRGTDAERFGSDRC
jgi:hypothetical protein